MARYHRRSGEKIIVREGPLWLRFVACVLAGFGLMFVYAGLSGWGFEQDTPLLVRVLIPFIGAFSVVCSPFVWRKAPNRTFTFDPLASKALLEEKTQGKAWRQELDFSEVQRVEMEEGRDDEGYINYRPVLHLTNGEHLPVRVDFLASEPCAKGLKDAIERVLQLNREGAAGSE